MEDISRAFEWIAVALLIVAFSLAVLAVTRDLARGEAASITYRRSREIFGREPVFISEVGPVLGAHIGPGMLGVGSVPESALERDQPA